MCSKIILIVSVLGCVSSTIATVKFDDTKPNDDINDRNIISKVGLKTSSVSSWIPSPEERKNCGSNDTGRLCCSVTREIKPYTLITQNSKNAISERIIQSEFFEQRVKETFCYNEGASCFKDFMYVNSDGDSKLEVKCKTDYGSMSLLVYNKQEDKIKWKNVPIAVSCSCHFDL